MSGNVAYCPACNARVGVPHKCRAFETTGAVALPDDPKERKTVPVVTGCLDYFPDAIAAVAELSYAATQQHHPGQPMHWDRTKSTDHADCAGRHLLQRGTIDTDGKRHSTKLAWRALAILQLEIEAERAQLVASKSTAKTTGN